MPFAHVHSITLTGVQGHLVEVEADITNGPPGLLLVGLPDAVVRETTDRVRAAILNSGDLATAQDHRDAVACQPA